MTEPEASGQVRSPHRHRRRRRTPAGRFFASIWSEWRVEAFVVVLVVLAVFLLVERMQIRQTLLYWLRQGLQLLDTLGERLVRGVRVFLRGTTLSDLTAYALLFIAVAFVVWRTRWRLVRMPRFTTLACPRCGSDLRRIHRSTSDRILGLFVPLRRYRCSNRECAWQGLRVSRRRRD
jgi:predicted RNA-binding Zn-ribbon protein involved in translation (DUF1610 family)